MHGRCRCRYLARCVRPAAGAREGPCLRVWPCEALRLRGERLQDRPACRVGFLAGGNHCGGIARAPRDSRCPDWTSTTSTRPEQEAGPGLPDAL